MLQSVGPADEDVLHALQISVTCAAAIADSWVKLKKSPPAARAKHTLAFDFRYDLRKLSTVERTAILDATDDTLPPEVANPRVPSLQPRAVERGVSQVSWRSPNHRPEQSLQPKARSKAKQSQAAALESLQRRIHRRTRWFRSFGMGVGGSMRC